MLWRQIRQEKKRRRIEERLRFFEPTESPYNEQRAFINSMADVRFIFGGNRSGKTEAGAADVLLFMLGQHPTRSVIRKPPVHGRICAPKYIDGCKLVILKKFREMIPIKSLYKGSWESAWNEQTKTLTLSNGSTAHFKSFEMDKNTFGGSDLDFVWDDEHGPEDYFLENMMRLADRNGYYIKTMTPESGQTWEQDFIDNPPEYGGRKLTVDYWFFDTEKNPYLSKEGVAKIKAALGNDPILAETKLKGSFMPLTGRVIPQWGEHNIIPDRELHRDAVRVFCIDLHTKAPSAAMWAAWEPDDIYGHRLIVYRTAKKLLTVTDWVSYIRAQSIGEKIEYRWGDETERETGTPGIHGQDSIIAEFCKQGLPLVQVQKGPSSYEAGIFKLRNDVSADPITGRTRIYMFRSCDYPMQYVAGKPCGSLNWEMKRFTFKQEQKADEEMLREKVRKINDHLIDDLRYIDTAGPMVTGSSIVVQNHADNIGVDSFTGV